MERNSEPGLRLQNQVWQLHSSSALLPLHNTTTISQNMPVRFIVAQHPAVQVRQPISVEKPRDCLDSTWGRCSKITCAELLQSSLDVPASWPPTQAFDALRTQVSTGQYLPSESFPEQSGLWDLSHIRPQANGFVDAVVEAYNKHHHLIIRPDDVWLAILSQFNLYVNANAENLRSYFVAHDGKKDLTVTAGGSRYSVDFGALAEQMTRAIDKNVLDKELRNWILPDFTTTTTHDTVASAVMMMSTLKAYFSYKMDLMCGIPSVTLEGKKEDWEKLLTRIDRLSIFGREPEAWSAMLRPILTRFVQAFDGDPGADFWNHVCHYQSMGSGSDVLSGWITAFCVWDEHGKWMGSSSVEDTLGKVKELSNRGTSVPPSIVSDSRHLKLEVDGIPYPIVEVDSIPPGFGEVDVKLDDNGEELDCMMVAGHMATRIEGLSKDMIRPHPAWFMFIKGQEEKVARDW
ncbi:hypothetical protein D9619_008675 [Psilocybe cf. subviscida]|uniref:DUF4419 domain-containing protein n=1 Tax=Psilocybe cf. subviscida TaxID=2480587 RepID=A0A8H5B9V3_9AGAR|nr:hypothetical protein D9619_008675 [Psilocybe cf. subviscida]